MDNQTDILEPFEAIQVKRRQLLPWWIKIFCWFFMVFGVAAIVCLALGLFGFTAELAFYGFETNQPLSFAGLVIIGTAIFKGFTAFSLWFEKDYAIALGKIDAILGIILCGFSMFILPFISNAHITIRLELALLIPYLIKLNKIGNDWNG